MKNVNSWWFNAGRVLSNVAEVVAPSVKTPLEDLKRHWNAIKSFYIDKQTDVESGNIPMHLNGIVRLLLEEDDERQLSDGTGPCTEFFLQEKMMDTLCALALVDRPQGVRKLILSAVTSILSNMKVLLIPHMSVHQALCNLIGGLTSIQLGGEVADAVAMIKVILNIIVQDPPLAEFFISRLTEDAEEERYVIWSVLISLRARVVAADERERIEDCMLLALNAANEHVMELMMLDRFHEQLASEICGLFGYLPPDTLHKAVETEQLYRYRLRVRFLGLLTSPEAGLTNYPNDFSDSLVHLCSGAFLERVLIPALFQHEESHDVTAQYTLYVKETLQLWTGPLMEELVRLLLEPQTLSVLCSRMMSINEDLSVASMRLFDVILGLYTIEAYHELVLKHVARLSEEESSKVSPHAAQLSAELLALFPLSYHSSDRTTGAALDGYVMHARGVIGDVYATLGDRLNRKLSRLEWDEAKQTQPMGVFLEACFSKLTALPRSSLRSNLLITSLFSRMLKFPSKAVFSCLCKRMLTVLEHVSKEAKQDAETMGLVGDKLDAALKATYTALYGLRDFEIGKTKDERAKFVEFLVVLEEFVREIVAIDQSRQVFYIEVGIVDFVKEHPK